MMKTMFLIGMIAGSALLALRPASAQTSVAGEAERAIVRSQQNLVGARDQMNGALSKRDANDLKGAYLDACQAISMSPSGSAASNVRKSLVSDYTSISLAYARQLANDGVFSNRIAERNGIFSPDGVPLSAESVAKSILDPSVDPGCKAAISFLSDLEQPEVFNKTVTPKFAAQRDEVTRLLREAGQLEQSGRHDLARKQYEAVLLIDPYNTAARKGMEAIDNAVLKYGDEAYNETRSRLLWQVEKAWERPPRKPRHGISTESIGKTNLNQGKEEMISKLNQVIIPKIEFVDTPISEAVEHLKRKSSENSPDKRGINILLQLGYSSSFTSSTNAGLLSTAGNAIQTPAPTVEPHVTLTLSQVPLYDVLQYICRLTDLKLKIDQYAVAIVPLTEQTESMVQRTWKVPGDFIPSQDSNTNASTPAPGLSANFDTQTNNYERRNAKDYLVEHGVDFPEGSTAIYKAKGSKLIVYNTINNLDYIDNIVQESLAGAADQVCIETKFLEINQNNLQELGFDWLLGPLSIGGGMYGAGGGNSANVNNANYPFVQGSSAVGMNPVGALRSGDSAISPNSVDALLAGKTGITDAASPGIFSIAGVFTEPQFQLVIHALNQKKGIDLMSAPKITTKNKVKAVIKIVNEFKYPKSYDQPQIPQSTGQNGVTIGGTFGTVNQPPPTVTPAFPRDFVKEDLGVTLEVTPEILLDKSSVRMELNPKVVDFDGFINYGSPINSAGYQPRPGTGLIVQEPVAQTLTTNVINEPVFTIREVNTRVTVLDGSTVSLGGLIREDVQKVQDKVPLLGDVPWAGRLFRSDSDQKIKKNLVIFVTPRILDADGQPRRDDTEEPEVVKPLGLPKDLPLPQQAKLGK